MSSAELSTETASEAVADNDDLVLSRLYRMLALALRSPVHGHVTAELVVLLQDLMHEAGLQGEARSLREADLMTPAGWEALQVEHTRLFVNAFPAVVAPPYASVYLDGGGMLQGPSSERFLRCYRAHGFAPAALGEPADSLGLALEFLALMVERGEHKAAEEFNREYLRPWLPLFVQRVLREARHPMYRGTVQLIDVLTKEDSDGD